MKFSVIYDEVIAAFERGGAKPALKRIAEAEVAGRPDHRLLRLKAGILESAGRRAEAERLWRRAGSLRPRDFEVAFELLELFIDSRRYAKAEHLLRLTKRKSRGGLYTQSQGEVSERLALEEARMFSARRLRKRAAAVLTRALQLHPRRARVRAALAQFADSATDAG